MEEGKKFLLDGALAEEGEVDGTGDDLESVVDGDDGPLEGHGRSFGYGHGGWGRVVGVEERESNGEEWGKEETIVNCRVEKREEVRLVGWLLRKAVRKRVGSGGASVCARECRRVIGSAQKRKFVSDDEVNVI